MILSSTVWSMRCVCLLCPWTCLLRRQSLQAWPFFSISSISWRTFSTVKKGLTVQSSNMYTIQFMNSWRVTHLQYICDIVPQLVKLIHRQLRNQQRNRQILVAGCWHTIHTNKERYPGEVTSKVEISPLLRVICISTDGRMARLSELQQVSGQRQTTGVQSTTRRVGVMPARLRTYWAACSKVNFISLITLRKSRK